MAVCTFRHRLFTTVVSAAPSASQQGFETTSVNERGNPCIMKVGFDHGKSQVTVELEEWNNDLIRMIDRRKWIFTPSILESHYWGSNPDNTLRDEPYVTIYPSSFSVAYDGSGCIETLTRMLAHVDSRPALEKFAHMRYPEPEKKIVVQIGFDKQFRIVLNSYPVRSLEEVERAAVTERHETSRAWFQKLLGKDWPAFA